LVKTLEWDLDVLSMEKFNDDMMLEFSNYLALHPFEPDMIVFNVGKHEIWEKTVEYIQNGLYYTIETGMVNFVAPHIVIFSTYEPNWDELTEDRWIVHEYKKTKKSQTFDDCWMSVS